ncbi:metal-dependent hydrolase [Burkholderia ubonensis]|uniref:metal-dependent hydrolase n=1 Tax=Burkholderia ubonensis TaxID=101571 RepID=UPI001E4C635B|nr:metal-dependent hydrolase [Burkholderia ubonensis]
MAQASATNIQFGQGWWQRRRAYLRSPSSNNTRAGCPHASMPRPRQTMSTGRPDDAMHAPRDDEADIRRRDPHFRFADDIPRYWYRGQSHVTRFFDAFSIMFPLGEKFFVDSVRQYRDALPADGMLAAQVDAFLYQEATHIREHRAYNRRLARQGMPVGALEVIMRRRQQQCRRVASPLLRLTFTACLEHYTAILADLLLRDPAILDGADPSMAAIWRWHAVEETEHRAVAFDVFRACGGGAVKRYIMRTAAMLGVTACFVVDLAYFVTRLAVADRDAGNWRSWARLGWWLFGAPGVFTRVLPAWLAWFSPCFHPSRIGNPATLAAARAALAAADAAATESV